MRQSLQQLVIQYGLYTTPQSVREATTIHRRDEPEEHQMRRQRPGNRM